MKNLKNSVVGAALSVFAMAAGFSANAGAAVPTHAITTPFIVHKTNLAPRTTLNPTPGTTNFTQGVTYAGTTRQVVFIHPSATSTGKAPVLLMLHGAGGSPVSLANDIRAGNLAAQMGYWVVLPPMANGQWNFNPKSLTDSMDDEGFLKTLIQTVVSQYPVDATRISMAGMSEGGFMTMRMACDQPQLLASVSAVAAEMQTQEAQYCAPTRPLPVLYVMGTSDPVVAYNGSNTFIGASNAFNLWSGIGACDPSQTTVTQLPVQVNDTTSVMLQHNAACASRGEVNLYTVFNGGHAWPGAVKSKIDPTGMTGIVSQNLDTTTTIGNFAKLWTVASTI